MNFKTPKIKTKENGLKLIFPTISKPNHIFLISFLTSPYIGSTITGNEYYKNKKKEWIYILFILPIIYTVIYIYTFYRFKGLNNYGEFLLIISIINLLFSYCLYLYQSQLENKLILFKHKSLIETIRSGIIVFLLLSILPYLISII